MVSDSSLRKFSATWKFQGLVLFLYGFTILNCCLFLFWWYCDIFFGMVSSVYGKKKSVVLLVGDAVEYSVGTWKGDGKMTAEDSQRSM